MRWKTYFQKIISLFMFENMSIMGILSFQGIPFCQILVKAVIILYITNSDTVEIAPYENDIFVREQCHLFSRIFIACILKIMIKLYTKQAVVDLTTMQSISCLNSLIYPIYNYYYYHYNFYN